VQSLATTEAAVRAAVYERLGEGRFSRWFGDEVEFALSVDTNALEVRTPCAYFREWIENHYRPILIEAVESVIGRRVDLSIQVYQKTEPASWNPTNPVVNPDEPSTDPQRITSGLDSVPGNLQSALPFRLQAPNDPGCSSPVGLALFSEIDRSRASAH